MVMATLGVTVVVVVVVVVVGVAVAVVVVVVVVEEVYIVWLEGVVTGGGGAPNQPHLRHSVH